MGISNTGFISDGLSGLCPDWIVSGLSRPALIAPGNFTPRHSQNPEALFVDFSSLMVQTTRPKSNKRKKEEVCDAP
jgi:hypothetical protein